MSRWSNGLVDGKAVAVISNLTGYVLKNLDRRKSVVGTVLYQLSHCGVVGRSKSLNWFGELVFNRRVNADLGELVRANDLERSRLGVCCPVCNIFEDSIDDAVRYETEVVK